MTTLKIWLLRISKEINYSAGTLTCYRRIQLCFYLFVIIMSRTSFRLNLHSKFCLNVKELFAWSRHHIWSNRIQTHNHLFVIIMSRTSFRLNLHSKFCLNVKELFAWSRHHIWSNRIQTHNHSVHKQTLNHFAKWLNGSVKWLSIRLQTKRLCVLIPLLSWCTYKLFI